jgi:hypothetical protein
MGFETYRGSWILMDSFDKFDPYYDEKYPDSLNEIKEIPNKEAFEPHERHHIAFLIQRRNELKGKEERGRGFETKHWNELQALNWVLTVLEEISEEDFPAENT